jgi:hypothetical protein
MSGTIFRCAKVHRWVVVIVRKNRIESCIVFGVGRREVIDMQWHKIAAFVVGRCDAYNSCQRTWPDELPFEHP